MKLDILIPNFDDLGAQRVAINAANGLKKNHDVRVVVNNAHGPFQQYLDPSIPVVCLDDYVLGIPKLRVLLRFVAYGMKVGQPDRVAVSYAPIMNLAALVGKLFLRNRVIIQEHALLSVALEDRQAHSWWLALAYRWVIIPAYRFADGFVTISEAIRRDLTQKFRVRADYMRVIPNPLDLSAIDRMANAQLPPGPWQRRSFIVGAGRLADQKDFGRLIQYFGDIAQAYPDVDLVILGKGERETELRATAAALGLAKRVHFAGFQRNPYVFFRHARMFCLTSVWEGLPQVLAEAMACGTPVVAHACPSGPDEMIDHMKTGVLTEYQNRSAMVASIKMLLNQGKRAVQLGQTGREYARRTYSIATYRRLLVKAIGEFA